MYGKINGLTGSGGGDGSVTWANVLNKPTNLETTQGAQNKADTAETNAKGYADDLVAGIQSGEITWQDILNKPADLETTGGAQIKATAALESAKTYTTDQIAAIPAPTWASITSKPTNLETTTGAQNKATTAENNAKAYTDQKIAAIPTDSGSTGGGNSTLDLTSYGVVNDGVADDTAGLKAYISDMISKGKPIYIPGSKFKYIISDQLLIESPVTVYGDGDRTWIHSKIRDKAPIKLNATSNCIIKDLKVSSLADVRTSSFQGAVTVQGCSHVLLQNITVDGAAATGFFITDSNNIKVLDNRIMNTLADGIHTTSKSYNVIVMGNHVIDSGDDGISTVSYQPQGARCKNIIFSNNVVIGSWARGITNVGSENVKIDNNLIENSQSCGILAHRDANPEYNTYTPLDTTISNNSVKNARLTRTLPEGKAPGNRNGIEIGDSDVTKIIGNTVLGCEHRGIAIISGARVVTLNDNESNNNDIVGFLLSSVGIVGGVNRARGNGEQGILLINSSYSTFESFNVYDNSAIATLKHNIHIENCNNIMIGNMISMETRTPTRIERAVYMTGCQNIKHGSVIYNKGTRPVFYNGNTNTNINADSFTLAEVPTIANFNNTFRIGQTVLNSANSTLYMWNGTAWVTFVTQ